MPRWVQDRRGFARLLAAVLAAALGVMAVSLGAAWFALGRTPVLRDFPSSATDAIVSILAGLAAMLMAGLRMRRRQGEAQGPKP